MSESKLNSEFNANGVNFESHDDTAKNDITRLQTDIPDTVAAEDSVLSPIVTSMETAPIEAEAETNIEAKTNESIGSENEVTNDANYAVESTTDPETEAKIEESTETEVEAEIEESTETENEAESQVNEEAVYENAVITETDAENESEAEAMMIADGEENTDITEGKALSESANIESYTDDMENDELDEDSNGGENDS